MSSFDQKPANGTMPASARAPARKVHVVIGSFLRKAAHLEQVLRVDCVDDGAGREEQERLEEGVRDQVEDPVRVGPDAERHHHVAELRDGRVGDHALDVALRRGDQRRKERGDAADPGDGRQRRRARLRTADTTRATR